MKSLRYIRIAVGVVVMTAMVFLFIDVTGLGADHFDFLARMQLVPAFLALNVLALVFLAVLVLLFGRLYCSVICPLGVFQDGIGWFGRLINGKRRRKIGGFRYKTEKKRTRLLILGCFVIVIVLGLLNVMAISLGAIIEPYSAFGRMVTAFVSPLYDVANNALASASAASGDYSVVPVNRMVPVALLVVATLTMIVVGGLALRRGREYCNTICPVGTLLGYVSKWSWLKIRIDADRCNNCGSCERHCKGCCIDSKNHVIDYTRCVDCFDCINVCQRGAIRYAPASVSRKTKEMKENTNFVTDKSRRQFMSGLALVTGAVVAKGAGSALDKVTDGGLTALKNRDRTQRRVRIIPPGAVTQARLNAHCVGCQLCIQACPEGVLQMSTDAATFMQPTMNFDKNYCLPECVRCSNVCPAGVFEPLDVAKKSSWKIGTAVVDTRICVSANGTDSCGNCARHCPAGAIEMAGATKVSKAKIIEKGCVDCGACIKACHVGAINRNGNSKPMVDPTRCIGCEMCIGVCGKNAIVMEKTDGNAMPIVNEKLCIGCGACEAHCPVGTLAWMEATQPAIHVEGVSPQRLI